MERGCLVKTAEGYFGIIKGKPNDQTATVLLCNGRLADIALNTLEGLPMRDVPKHEQTDQAHEADTADACFPDLIEAIESMERVRRIGPCPSCPIFGGGNG